jgi:hypothetical protein
MLDGIAVVENCDRQRDQAGVGLHLLVTANGDVEVGGEKTK